MTRSFKEGEGLAPVRVEASTTANSAKVLDGLHTPSHDEEDDLKALQDKIAEDGVESPKSAHAQGGFRFDTPEHKAQLAAQRQQLWQWLKGVGQHMFREGINLTKISLPVCLFEARSFLERMTTNWEYQDLLTAASRAIDPVDRMRYIVAFAVSGLSRQVSFHKPFNPILGETYQAQYPNGVQVFCEQICHHPPVSSWQVYEPNGQFVFHGSGNWSAGIKGNSVKGRQTGINCVEFADGSKITYELPGLQVKGVLWGDRVLKYSGEMVFKDEKNDLIAEIQIDFHPHSSGFLHLGSWFSRKKAVPYKPDQITGTLKQGGQIVDTANGNWLHYFEWEKGTAGGSLKRLWDIKLSKLTPAVPVESPLESDCRNRLDVVHLRSGDQAKAQEWKLKLEEAQRRDRKVRKEGGGYAEH